MAGFLSVGQAPSTLLAKVDPRCKLIALFICSMCILCIDTWIGLGGCACALILSMAMGRIHPRKLLVLSIPLLVILLIIWLCNAFIYNPVSVQADTIQTDTQVSAQTEQTLVSSAALPVSSITLPVLSIAPPFALPIQFSVAGAQQGALYVLRIWFLFIATFVVVLTTSYESILRALTALLSPLRALKFPVDDAAMIATLALRFIPLVAEQTQAIKRAQRARAAQFDVGSVWKKVTAWMHVFIPLFVMLFRQADRMAVAMEARCYGARIKRSSLNNLALHPLQVCATTTLCLVFIVIAVWL